MKGIIAWFAQNGVVANLLMASLIFAGFLSIPGIKKEVFPDFEVDVITVQVPYRGAAPEEVEEGVCVRVEEAIQALDGIKRITSTANEGVGSVTIEVETGYDLRKLLDEVKAQVDTIETFPLETERPVVQQPLIRNQVINISVSGETDDRTMRLLGERVRDEVLMIDGISQVDLKYARLYEIAIEVSEKQLRRHGLTFDEVAAAVRRSSLDMPGGAVRTEKGEILLRTLGQAYVGREFENLTLMSRADGSRLTIADIGRVVDDFEENDKWARFDGKPTVLVQVYRVSDENALDIVANVRTYVQQAQSSMPEGIELTTWKDTGEVLEDRIDLLTRNALNGLILVFIILALFLRPTLAFWVAVGIPVSFLGAFAVMPHFDVSINMMSLFAFILVLGIVVDDAIVVAESIYAAHENGVSGLKGSVTGTKRVSVPVIFGVLTTMVAFTPLLFIEGTISNFTRVIPIIVISCLLFSLIESQLVLPNHLSHHRAAIVNARRGFVVKIWDGFFNFFRIALESFIRYVYQPVLRQAIAWRYVTVAVSLVTLMITAGLVASGKVKFVFMEMDESNNIDVSLTMPLETSAEVTGAEIEKIELSLMEFRKRYESENNEVLFRHMLSSVGEQTSGGMGPGGGVASSASYLGGVAIELVPSEERSLSAEQVAALLRQVVEPVPGAVEMTIKSGGMSGGESMDIQLVGPDFDQLKIAAEELKGAFSNYNGVTNIADSFRGGKPEIKLSITSKAEALGLSLQDLGRQVRQGFFGEQAQRIQRDRDDVRVMVRYPADERNTIGDLQSMRIRTPDGGEVPFPTVARAEMGRGYSAIRRVDRERAINVTADIDPDNANANEIIADLEAGYLPELLERYPGVRYSLEGRQEDQKEFMDGMKTGFVYVILIMYAMLAIPFRSYIQPVLVLSSVPFGIVGAIWGHAIMGLNLTALSLMGIIAVAGIVVNDSLVLVSFVNENRRSGKPMADVVRMSGLERFRPILLTSLTTAAGIAPLMLERSVQARFLIPMAVSIAFGVLFSTVITLLLVPAGYVILDDFRRCWDWLLGRTTGRVEAVTVDGELVEVTVDEQGESVPTTR